jgi:hypothetical protein
LQGTYRALHFLFHPVIIIIMMMMMMIIIIIITIMTIIITIIMMMIIITIIIRTIIIIINGSVISVQALIGPEGSRRLRIQGFLRNRQQKVTSFSALHTSRLYFQGSSLILISVRG